MITELHTVVEHTTDASTAGTGKCQARPSSRSELDSGMHGLGSEAGEWAESFKDTGHERRERDAHNPSALKGL